MKLEPPYKQYEGKWLSSDQGAIVTPIYFIAKFLSSEQSDSYEIPIVNFLVVNWKGFSDLAWFVENTQIQDKVNIEKYRAVIKGTFDGRYQ